MYVYILKSECCGRSYVGVAEDIHIRLQQHNRGYNTSTKAYRPWVLIRAEEYRDKSLALKRERFLKSGVGRRVLKNLCSGNAESS